MDTTGAPRLQQVAVCHTNPPFDSGGREGGEGVFGKGEWSHMVGMGQGFKAILLALARAGSSMGKIRATPFFVEGVTPLPETSETTHQDARPGFSGREDWASTR